MSNEDNAITTSKALERSARVAHMLEQQNQRHGESTTSVESDQAKTEGNHDVPSPTISSPLRVGAFFVKNAARNRTSKHENKSNTNIPSALSDLERKVSGQPPPPPPQQPPVSAGGDTTMAKDDSSSSPKLTWRRPFSDIGPAPGSVIQVMHTRNGSGTAALSAQERELLAKSSGGGNKFTAAANYEVLVDEVLVDKAATMGTMIHHMMATTFNSSSSSSPGTGNGAQQPQRLEDQEANALLKQRLPREMMIPRDDDTTYDASQVNFHHDISTTELEEEPRDLFDSSSPTLTAEIVDDAQERKKIAQEAQDALISNAVIATFVDDDDSFHKKRQAQYLCIAIACVLLVLTAIILGGVCGTGNCPSSRAYIRQNAAARAKGITDFVASITRFDVETKLPLTYPYNGTDERSPEQEALEHLIDGDALLLSVGAVSQGDDDDIITANWRLIQRYALLVIWFTNGPWIEPNVSEEDNGVATIPLASAAWLVGTDECGWAGVKCDDTGRVVLLHLEARELTGTVPKDMGLLSNLNELRLEGNALTGSLHDTIAVFIDMAALLLLDLGRNRLDGTIPELLLAQQFNSSLKALSLNYNLITGTIPESIATMTGLEMLNINDNIGLIGTIPTSLAGLTSLTALGLGFGGFSPRTPNDFFDGMTNLTQLDFGGVYDGELYSLSQLSGLSQLTHLVYSATVMEGTIPPEVVDWWPNMNTLSLTKCNITGTLPVSLSRWTLLSSINLSLNKLTGSIPLSYYTGWADTLTAFSVPYNELVGSLPSELGLWSKLGSLDVRTNALTGSLPTTIGLLTDVLQILVSGNQFTGTIPNEVLGATNALVAEYDSNDLTGVAPFCENESTLIHVKVDCLEVSCPCCLNCN